MKEIFNGYNGNLQLGRDYLGFMRFLASSGLPRVEDFIFEGNFAGISIPVEFDDTYVHMYHIPDFEVALIYQQKRESESIYRRKRSDPVRNIITLIGKGKEVGEVEEIIIRHLAETDEYLSKDS